MIIIFLHEQASSCDEDCRDSDGNTSDRLDRGSRVLACGLSNGLASSGNFTANALLHLSRECVHGRLDPGGDLSTTTVAVVAHEALDCIGVNISWNGRGWCSG